MGSKLAAAKIAVWSGVEAVIADASRPGVLAAVLASAPGVGTRFRPRERRLPARKLWIAFAMGASGTIVVDAGARRALVERGRSLLPAGVVSTRASSGSTTPWRSPAPTAGSSPRAWCASRPPWSTGGPGGTPTNCPTTWLPRWSTGTTWWCWSRP